MSETKLVINNLLDLWYSCIKPTHFKDKDCHFRIRMDFCTYRKLEYTVEHHGYILHHIPYENSFATYEEAESYLISLLIYGISREIKTSLDCKQDEDNWTDLCQGKAKEIKKELEILIGEFKLEKELDFAKKMSIIHP